MIVIYNASQKLKSYVFLFNADSAVCANSRTTKTENLLVRMLMTTHVRPMHSLT